MRWTKLDFLKRKLLATGYIREGFDGVFAYRKEPKRELSQNFGLEKNGG